MITGIDHIQLAMPIGGEPDAEKFYAGLLGLEPIPKPEPLASRGGCWFSIPGAVAQVHLGADPMFQAAKKAHPAFTVIDRSALVDRLRGARVPVRDGATIDGVMQVFCDDPFGNRIELIEQAS